MLKKTTATLAVLVAGMAAAQDINRATFNEDGSVNQPENWRSWVFVGAPLTPNALNGGEAPFPEFHNVYIEPSAFAYWQETGEWADGTQLAKELVLLLKFGGLPTGLGQRFLRAKLWPGLLSGRVPRLGTEGERCVPLRRRTRKLGILLLWPPIGTLQRNSDGFPNGRVQCLPRVQCGRRFRIYAVLSCSQSRETVAALTMLVSLVLVPAVRTAALFVPDDFRRLCLRGSRMIF